MQSIFLPARITWKEISGIFFRAKKNFPDFSNVSVAGVPPGANDYMHFQFTLTSSVTILV